MSLLRHSANWLSPYKIIHEKNQLLRKRSNANVFQNKNWLQEMHKIERAD